MNGDYINPTAIAMMHIKYPRGVAEIAAVGVFISLMFAYFVLIYFGTKGNDSDAERSKKYEK